jgi:hypothetical protein
LQKQEAGRCGRTYEQGREWLKTHSEVDGASAAGMWGLLSAVGSNWKVISTEMPRLREKGLGEE